MTGIFLPKARPSMLLSLRDIIINVKNSTVELILGETFTINAITVSAGLNLTYVVDNSGVVEVDGEVYSAPLSNGSASITIPALSEGSHNVTVRYTGDENYSSVTQQTTLNVSAPVYKLSNNKDVSALYSAKATYKVLVTGDGKAVGAGEIVTFKYNGKTYKVQTDNKGYAILNLSTELKVKKYTVAAAYKGVKVTNKVTVNNIINAKNKKVKKSKKVTKVKVSLKKVNGKYLVDKVIKIKFNGKTYKRVTNKKGVATWYVKKSMVKKLKAGKKYKYTVTTEKTK